MGEDAEAADLGSTFDAIARYSGPLRPVPRATVRVGSARAVTDAAGRARVRYRFAGRAGPRRVRVFAPGFAAAGVRIRVVARTAGL